MLQPSDLSRNEHSFLLFIINMSDLSDITSLPLLMLSVYMKKTFFNIKYMQKIKKLRKYTQNQFEGPGYISREIFLFNSHNAQTGITPDDGKVPKMLIFQQLNIRFLFLTGICINTDVKPAVNLKHPINLS
ncbi:hypothetical protein NRS6167_13565 [Bacillus subtilis]|nr:hypothetical protein NRS6167_02102 [Bacillus subtilis]CAI6285608.1 hypothetical protein NRS6167_13565 [Bacillus subtilis]